MKILFSLCFYFFAVCSFAQTSIVWERTLGGSKRESGYSITLTKDGGSVVCIEAESDDGDVIKAGDYADFWIVKLSKDGIIQWRKSFEGNGYDLPTSIVETIDGGLVVCGGTHIVENETVNWAGNWDAWVIKLNFIGELEWESKFGGRYTDGANAITNSLNSISFVGAVTTNPITGYDAWIVNMLPNGTFNWSKNLSGNQNEIFSNVKQTNDNGLLCVGYTASTTGDFGNGFGNEDGLLVKFDSAGTLKWYKRLGKDKSDILRDLEILENGNIIAMGYSESYADFVSPASKGENLWVVMMDSLGNVLWEKIYPGAIGTNFGYSIKKYDNSSFVIAGADYKNDMDCRIVKINSDGVLLWDAHYGGSSEDYALSLCVTNQKDIIVAGYTFSNDGDISNYKGSKDAWVVKLQVNDSLFTSVYEQFKLPIIVPNPSSTQFSITVDIETEDKYTIQLVSIDGSIVETVFSGLLPKGTKEIAVFNSNLQSGTYFCVVKNTENMVTQKFQIVK